MRSWSFFLIKIVAIMFIVGCVTFVRDPSMSAVEAHANTLISFNDGISACTEVPHRGVTACEVKEGSQMASVWKVVVPHDQKYFVGGEITLYYRDIVKSYPVQSSIVEIAWSDFFGASTWGEEHSGIVLAAAKLRFKDDKGVEEVLPARGIVVINVTKSGYDPIPLDSGYIMWKKKFSCEVGYSTAGRSAVRCK